MPDLPDIKDLHIRRSIRVMADVPLKVPREDIARFVIEALQAWGGGLDPEDPLFHSMSVKTIKIGRDQFRNAMPKKMD